LEDIALLGLGVTNEPVVKATKDLKAFDQQADEIEKLPDKGLEGTAALLARDMGCSAHPLDPNASMWTIWTGPQRCRSARGRIDEMGSAPSPCLVRLRAAGISLPNGGQGFSRRSEVAAASLEVPR
jgi:hypothetical protein